MKISSSMFYTFHLQSSVAQKNNINFNVKRSSLIFYNLHLQYSVTQEKHKFQSEKIICIHFSSTIFSRSKKNKQKKHKFHCKKIIFNVLQSSSTVFSYWRKTNFKVKKWSTMFHSFHLQSSVTQEKHIFQSEKIIYNVLHFSSTIFSRSKKQHKFQCKKIIFNILQSSSTIFSHSRKT